MRRVIDFHVHPPFVDKLHPWVVKWMQEFYQQDLPTYLETYNDPAKFVEMMDANGVAFSVLVAEYSPVTTGYTSSEQVLEFCRHQPRLLPFANINPYVDPEPVKMLRSLVEEGVRGLKMYPTYQFFYPNDAQLYPLYAAAQELGIPVMFHTGSSIFKGSRIKYGNPVYFDDVAVDFPELKLVMSHSGRGFWYQEAFFLARLHPNLYMEIAGLPPERLLTYFPEFERNAKKVIFGSDWPGMTGIKRNIQAIKDLPLKPESIEHILWSNAAEILNIKG